MAYWTEMLGVYITNWGIQFINIWNLVLHAKNGASSTVSY